MLASRVARTALSSSAEAAATSLSLADRVASHMSFVRARVFATWGLSFALFCTACGLLVHKLMFDARPSQNAPARSEPSR